MKKNVYMQIKSFPFICLFCAFCIQKRIDRTREQINRMLVIPVNNDNKYRIATRKWYKLIYSCFLEFDWDLHSNDILENIIPQILNQMVIAVNGQWKMCDKYSISVILGAIRVLFRYFDSSGDFAYTHAGIDSPRQNIIRAGGTDKMLFIWYIYLCVCVWYLYINENYHSINSIFNSHKQLPQRILYIIDILSFDMLYVVCFDQHIYFQ